MEYIKAFQWTNTEPKEVRFSNDMKVVYTHLAGLPDVLKVLSHEYVLVTEGGDFSVYDDGGQYIIRTANHVNSKFDRIPDNVKYWFSTNLCIKHDKCQALPQGFIHTIDPMANDKTALLYANFDVGTNTVARMPVFNHFVNLQDWCTCDFPNRKVNKTENEVLVKNYFHQLSKHKYVLSPPGHGWDCYRTWEALYCETIPVVLDSPFYDYFDLPFLRVSSWQEVTLELLESRYEELSLKFKNKQWLDREFYKRMINDYV